MNRQDHDDQKNDWMKSMNTQLKSVDHNYWYRHGLIISIVPEVLKKSNRDAYMPRVVSIGPRFKESSEDLLFMEEVKWQCMIFLLYRAGIGEEMFTYLDQCSEAIWKLDKKVRERYVADIKLEKHELAKIMLVDGCFLLELLVTKGLDAKLPTRELPSPAPEVLRNEDVLSDLMLVENQIPTLVLHELSRILFPGVFEEGVIERATRINNLALSVLGYPPLQIERDLSNLLDIVHYFVNRKTGADVNHVVVDNMDPPNNVKLKLKRCALRLLTGGITIKLAEDTDSGVHSSFSLLRNRFSGVLTRLGDFFVTTEHTDLDMPAEDLRGLDFEFKFEKGELKIAQLHITKTTKARWCNVIAWEHIKKNRERRRRLCDTFDTISNQRTTSLNGKFTYAALIFNGLICSIDDVQLLKDKNIIVDHLKMSNDELLAFFRTISLGVNRGVVDSSFIKMVDELNKYSPPNVLMQTWKKVSISFIYRQEWLVRFMNRNYNFVATVLAVLSIVQTVYAVLAYYLPK